MKKLFLDDMRQVKDACYYVSNPRIYWEEDWDIVRNYDEFVEYIEKNGLPDLISFDHDLADEHYNDLFSDENWVKDDDSIDLKYESYKEKTGLECAKWLVDFCFLNRLPIPEFMVHSANPVGKKNIVNYLENAKKHLKMSNCKKKVSFDFDGTLSRDDVEEFAKQLINDGYEVWIVTSRPSDEDLTNSFQPWAKPNWNLDIWDTCERLNIPKEHVKFTNYVDKIEFLKGKGFIFHLDDDVDELVEIMNDVDEPCMSINVNHSEWKKTCLDFLK